MGDRFYATAKHFCRFVRRQCFTEVILHRERAERPGGYILACTHVSHIEPMLVSGVLDRDVKWMARVEFYRVPVLRTLLHHLDCFCVNRQGVPVSAIRTAIRLANDGKVVGIFPEGGCVTGNDLAFRGGKIKQGLCVVAARAQVPVLPVVVLGTNHLTKLDPWLPGRHGKVWISFGHPIDPPPVPKRSEHRKSRAALAGKIEREFVRIYQELLAQCNLSESLTP